MAKGRLGPGETDPEADRHEAPERGLQIWGTPHRENFSSRLPPLRHLPRTRARRRSPVAVSVRWVRTCRLIITVGPHPGRAGDRDRRQGMPSSLAASGVEGVTLGLAVFPDAGLVDPDHLIPRRAPAAWALRRRPFPWSPPTATAGNPLTAQPCRSKSLLIRNVTTDATAHGSVAATRAMRAGRRLVGRVVGNRRSPPSTWPKRRRRSRESVASVTLWQLTSRAAPCPPSWSKPRRWGRPGPAPRRPAIGKDEDGSPQGQPLLGPLLGAIRHGVAGVLPGSRSARPDSWVVSGEVETTRFAHSLGSDRRAFGAPDRCPWPRGRSNPRSRPRAGSGNPPVHITRRSRREC